MSANHDTVLSVSVIEHLYSTLCVSHRTCVQYSLCQSQDIRTRSRPDIRSGPVRSGIRLILTRSGPVRFYQGWRRRGCRGCTAPPEIWTGGARTPLKFAEIFAFYRCGANCLCPHPGVYCQSNYRRAGCLCN